MKTNSMYNLLASDFYKVRFLKSVIIAPFLMLLMILFNYAVFWIQPMFDDSLPQLTSGLSMLFGATGYTGMSLFIAIIAGIFIGGEFSSGTMGASVARGADRAQIYFSKWLVTAALVAFYTLASFLVCAIFSAFGPGMGSVSGADVGYLLRSVALQLLINLMGASFFVMFAFLTRSRGAAIGVSLAAYLLFRILISIFSAIALVGGADTDWVIDAIGYMPTGLLEGACMPGAYELSDLMRLIFMPIAYIGLTFAVGVPTFIKRDIK